MSLNVEELSLLSVFATGSKEKAAEGVRYFLKTACDKDLISIAESVLSKLSIMTEAEYAALDYSDVEDAYGQ